MGRTVDDATLGGVSGNGTVRYATAATFSGTFAPSIGGTIRFQEPPESISGTLKIAGDSTRCGMVKFDKKQDISGLTLKMKIADISTFVDAPNGIEGKITKSADFPSDWDIKYADDGVYVYRPKGLLLIIR